MDKVAEKTVAVLNRTPLWVLLAAVIVGSTIPMLPTIEGYWFPVAGTMQLKEVKLVREGTQITYQIEKLRDCQFKSMAFYIKKSDGAFLRVNDRDPSRAGSKQSLSRPKGLNEITQIIETTAPMRDWLVTVSHSCHLGPDVTTTIWP